MSPDAQLRKRIRTELPARVFTRRPYRALLVAPLLTVPIVGAVIIIGWAIPWYLALLIGIVSGNSFAGLMLLGHEIGHGATVRKGPLQTFLLFICLGIFCISPHIWPFWHNRAHHANTNHQPHDPDNFGSWTAFKNSPRAVRFLARLGPGSAHWTSAFYLFLGLTVHGANVLLRKSRTGDAFNEVKRRRAIVESAGLGLFWLSVSIAVGAWAALFIVVVPMLTANFIVTSYFITNHSLRPLTSRRDTLGTTVDVKTWKLFDRLHFHTSHHAEHHLFPGVCTSQLPAVRSWLYQNTNDRFIVLPHWKALYHAYRVPKVYDGPDTLIEPFSERRVDIATVESGLRLSAVR